MGPAGGRRPCAHYVHVNSSPGRLGRSGVIRDAARRQQAKKFQLQDRFVRRDVPGHSLISPAVNWPPKASGSVSCRCCSGGNRYWYQRARVQNFMREKIGGAMLKGSEVRGAPCVVRNARHWDFYVPVDSPSTLARVWPTRFEPRASFRGWYSGRRGLGGAMLRDRKKLAACHF